MKCPRCLNEDPAFFYYGSHGWYCRKCISFGRVMVEEEQEPVSLETMNEEASEYVLKYPLTALQKEISIACMEKIQTIDVLIHSCCGSGKTEMVIHSIVMMMQQKKKVCFAIARRQVVLEIAERMQSYFPHAEVIPVCQGYTSITDGDLIVCTTHQLYRYHQSFDLLILDEPDAFPFKGSDVLHGIAKSACRGHMIYLTATPDKELLRRVEEGGLYQLTLNHRPHGKDIPVPVIHTAPKIILLLNLMKWLKEHADHPRMVFVPTIHISKILYLFLRVFLQVSVCTSKSEDRDEIIERFREEENGVIIATTVLERGVTIPNADICVYLADHSVFDEASLIQMAGRAGRAFENPDGDVLFLCQERSTLAEKCRTSILEANQS